MQEMEALLTHRQFDGRQVRERVYRAPNARKRERWHALWLLARGWSAAEVADALDRDAHTVGMWLRAFRRAGPASVAFEQTGGPPPALNREQQAELKAAVRAALSAAGLDLANWNWRVVRAFAQQQFGLCLSRLSCLNYLQRLGFVLKRRRRRQSGGVSNHRTQNR